jgi:hypothetical protein
MKVSAGDSASLLPASLLDRKAVPHSPKNALTDIDPWKYGLQIRQLPSANENQLARGSNQAFNPGNRAFS